MSNLVFYLGYFHGELNLDLALTLVFLHKVLYVLQVASAQMFLGLKALMIFNPEVISEVSDLFLHSGFRIASGYYGLLLLALGWAFANPKTPFFLHFLTGSDGTT